MEHGDDLHTGAGALRQKCAVCTLNDTANERPVHGRQRIGVQLQLVGLAVEN